MLHKEYNAAQRISPDINREPLIPHVEWERLQGASSQHLEEAFSNHDGPGAKVCWGQQPSPGESWAGKDQLEGLECQGSRQGV